MCHRSRPLVRIERDEIALAVAGEHQSAGRREHAGPRVRVLLELPPHRSGLRIDGAHGALRSFFGHREERAADERPARPIRRLELFVRHERVALLVAEEIDQMRARAVGRRVPVGSAGAARTDAVALGRRIGVRQHDGPAVGVDLLRPRHLRVRPAEQVRAGHAIQHVEEPVAVGDRHQLARLCRRSCRRTGSACAWSPSRARRAA